MQNANEQTRGDSGTGQNSLRLHEEETLRGTRVKRKKLRDCSHVIIYLKTYLSAFRLVWKSRVRNNQLFCTYYLFFCGFSVIFLCPVAFQDRIESNTFTSYLELQKSFCLVVFCTLLTNMAQSHYPSQHVLGLLKGLLHLILFPPQNQSFW